MKDGMTLWKMESRSPKPFSPVQRALKFSAVLGTMWEKSSMVTVPSGWPSAATSRNTRGLVSLECSWTLDICGEEIHEASPSVWPMRLWHSQKVFLKDSPISGVLNLAASCSTTPSPSGKTEGKTISKRTAETHQYKSVSTIYFRMEPSVESTTGALNMGTTDSTSV